MKNKKKVYWTSVEYEYSEKTEEYGTLEGGFAFAFVNAFDVLEALDRVLEALKKQGLLPIKVEFVSPYETDFEWESKEQTEHYFGLYMEARGSKDVILDDFYAYEKRE